MTEMRHLYLCSGIGGFALGFQWAALSKPVMFCDTEEWCRKVLAKHWPDVPISTDVKELANEPERIPDFDILTAGYPCQPFSLAGERRGKEDDRHIWPDIFRIVQAKRPAWCVFENVYGHVSMGLDEVLSDLEGEGYATRPFIVPACAVDAPHRRDRLWIIARDVENTRHRRRRDKRPVERGQDAQGRRPTDSNQVGGSSEQPTLVADTESEGLQDVGGCSELGREQDRRSLLEASSSATRTNSWKPEPPVGRVANGIPRRVDRLRGLGNAIVPQIAMKIGLAIKEQEQ